MQTYNIFISNCLDSSLRIVTTLSYDDLTQIDHDIIKNYIGIKLCKWSREKIHHIEPTKVHSFAATEKDFEDIDNILTIINK